MTEKANDADTALVSASAPVKGTSATQQVLSVLGGIAVLMGLQTAYMVPTILSQAREMMDDQIDRHKEDLGFALQGIHARLDSIERRLDGK